MDAVVTTILTLEGLFFAACLVILVVLIFRRIEAKKHEDLDEYDN